MSNLTTVKHKIQIQIIDYLAFHEIGRFKDLRPKGVDTNLCTYHLGKLVGRGLVDKRIDGYSLSLEGVAYVENRDNLTSGDMVRPKITILFLVQNSDGDVLLERRTKQPFMNRWMLPFGDIYSSDVTVLDAAQREFKKKFNNTGKGMVHAGICYIRVKNEQGLQYTTAAHIFSCNSDEIRQADTISWARPHKLDRYRLAPATQSIIARGFFNDPFFFEEFEEMWPDADASS